MKDSSVCMRGGLPWLLAALGAALGRGAGLAAKIGAGLLAWAILLGWWILVLVTG